MARTTKAKTTKAKEPEVVEEVAQETPEVVPEVAEEAPVETPAPEAPTPKKGKATQAVVFAENGAEVRTYSLEAHGADFESLAKSYVSNPSRATYRIELR